MEISDLMDGEDQFNPCGVCCVNFMLDLVKLEREEMRLARFVREGTAAEKKTGSLSLIGGKVLVSSFPSFKAFPSLCMFLCFVLCWH